MISFTIRRLVSTDLSSSACRWWLCCMTPDDNTVYSTGTRPAHCHAPLTVTSGTWVCFGHWTAFNRYVLAAHSSKHSLSTWSLCVWLELGLELCTVSELGKNGLFQKLPIAKVAAEVRESSLLQIGIFTCFWRDILELNFSIQRFNFLFLAKLVPGVE